jgi:hypothetical protein
MLMFLSLQLARGDEHSGSGFRRLLYGYNAVLTGLLLFLILSIINALTYIPWGPFAWFNSTYYWATASIYSLSPQSEKVLEGLDKPVKIYVLITQRNELYHPIRALLDNCRSVNPSIQVKYLSPDLDQEEVNRLAQDYKFGGERAGVLIVYGSGDKSENRFIKPLDLINDSGPMMGRTKAPQAFKGESAIISELNSMALGKEKPTIYFTQGDGEPDLADTQRGRPGEGLGLLKERLQANNYTVKGLQFSPAGGTAKNPDVVVSKTVPEDAFLVVIVAPHSKFEKFAIDALRNYMEPSDPKAGKGKLMVYMDVVLTADKSMENLGLEPFLGEFGVQVNNNRILSIAGGEISNPQRVIAIMNPERSVRQHNPVVDSFPFPSAFVLYNITRTVEAKPAGPQSNPRYRSELMMIVPQLQQQAAWAETNLQTDPVTLIQEYNRKGELEKKIASDHLPVAVAVTENIPSAAGGPHAGMQGDEKPRLIVFGNGSLVSNILVDKSNRTLNYDLFASCVAWLRERPTNIGIEPKNRDSYAFPVDANVGRMVGLPAMLMVVGIIGLGTGVWVVRRR